MIVDNDTFVEQSFMFNLMVDTGALEIMVNIVWHQIAHLGQMKMLKECWYIQSTLLGMGILSGLSVDNLKMLLTLLSMVTWRVLLPIPSDPLHNCPVVLHHTLWRIEAARTINKNKRPVQVGLVDRCTLTDATSRKDLDDTGPTLWRQQEEGEESPQDGEENHKAAT